MQIDFRKKSLPAVLTPYLGYLHTKFGINRTSRLGMCLYTDRQTHRKTLCFIIIRDSKNAISQHLLLNHIVTLIIIDRSMSKKIGNNAVFVN